MSDTPRTETILREIAAHCEEKGWVAYDVDAYSAGQLQMFAHTLERELAEARERIKFLEQGLADTALHLIKAGIPAFGWNWEGVDKLAAENAKLREAGQRVAPLLSELELAHRADDWNARARFLQTLARTEPPARGGGRCNHHSGACIHAERRTAPNIEIAVDSAVMRAYTLGREQSKTRDAK